MNNSLLSIGILTHNAPATLRNTLESYKKVNFFKYSNDIYCVIQQSDLQVQEIDICIAYGVTPIALNNNGRMAGGFMSIVHHAKNPYILFLENDFVVEKTEEDVDKNMQFVFNNLGKYDYIKLRSRQNAGEPNCALTLIGRELENKHHLSETMYWITHPDVTFSEYIKLANDDPKYYMSNSECCSYTNNPYVCSKDFFMTYVAPHCVFGLNIECQIPEFWKKEQHSCVFGDGIFTHKRI